MWQADGTGGREIRGEPACDRARLRPASAPISLAVVRIALFSKVFVPQRLRAREWAEECTWDATTPSPRALRYDTASLVSRRVLSVARREGLALGSSISGGCTATRTIRRRVSTRHRNAASAAKAAVSHRALVSQASAGAMSRRPESLSVIAMIHSVIGSFRCPMI